MQYTDELTIPANTKNLETVLDFIVAALESAGCHGECQTQIAVAAEEIFVSIARYAYGAEGGSVRILISADDEAVLKFRDTVIPFNPLTKEAAQ